MEGVIPEHDVTPMASDHLPLRVARLFLIFPCQLAKKTKQNTRAHHDVLFLLQRFERFVPVTNETRERSALCEFFFVCLYVRACALLACKPPQKKPSFLNLFCIDRYSVTGIDYRWNFDKRYNGWPIDNRPTTD